MKPWSLRLMLATIVFGSVVAMYLLATGGGP